MATIPASWNVRNSSGQYDRYYFQTLSQQIIDATNLPTPLMVARRDANGNMQSGTAQAANDVIIKSITDAHFGQGGSNIHPLAIPGTPGFTSNDYTNDRLALPSTIYAETSTSATTRTVTIAGVPSLALLLNRPIWITSAATGTNATTTLNINSFGTYNVRQMINGSFVNPIANWCYVGSRYCVVFDGSYFNVAFCDNSSVSLAVMGLQKVLIATITSSQTIDLSTLGLQIGDKIDVFMVAGGSAGGNGTANSYSGRGGNGGQCILIRNYIIAALSNAIVIGAGGVSPATNGGNTTAFGYTANGGAYNAIGGGTLGGRQGYYDNSTNNKSATGGDGNLGTLNPYDGVFYGCSGGAGSATYGGGGMGGGNGNGTHTALTPPGLGGGGAGAMANQNGGNGGLGGGGGGGGTSFSTPTSGGSGGNGILYIYGNAA